MHALPWPSQSLVTLKKAPNVYPHTDTWTPILTPNLTQTKLLVRPISANKKLALLCHLLKTTARLSPHDATHSASGHIWPPPLPPAPWPSCHLLVMMTVEGLKGPLPLLLSAVYLDVSSMWLTLTLTLHLTYVYKWDAQNAPVPSHLLEEKPWENPPHSQPTTKSQNYLESEPSSWPRLSWLSVSIITVI